MQIKSVEYSQFADNDRSWKLHKIDFERISLIVGKNASGKSKTLNLIYGLSTILGENRPLTFEEGSFDVKFVDQNEEYRYVLDFHSRVITKEQLFITGNVRIDRNENGHGFIRSTSGNEHRFAIPTNELKATRRDSENYPYLENLNYWAKHVRLFEFSSQQKNNLAIKDPAKKPTEFNLKNTAEASVLIAFNQGKKDYPDVFLENVVRDFNSIGYNIETVEIGPLISANFQTLLPNTDVVGLRVKEKDISCMTDQFEMSNGMFRALNIIVYFNYYVLANIPGLVLIDDIGEGLDYERSAKLIQLLIEKVERNENMQLIMSTNDSFVMNAVDLKYWQVIDREGPEVKYYNHKNSKKAFEDYVYTGLNNFDFFTTGFFKTGFDSAE